MANQQPQTPQGDGFLNSFTLRIRLIASLMTDARVSPLLKVLPAFGLLYFIVPDLLPGPIDDGALLWLGSYLFVQFCPANVVAEHWLRLTGQPYRPGSTPVERKPPDDDVIDAEFRDIDK